VPIGNESLPKIIINDTINLFFKLLSNQDFDNFRPYYNSFRVLFDNIASVYFILKIDLYFSVGNGQHREPPVCQLYRHTFVPYMRVITSQPIENAEVSRCQCDFGHLRSSEQHAYGCV